MLPTLFCIALSTKRKTCPRLTASALYINSSETIDLWVLCKLLPLPWCWLFLFELNELLYALSPLDAIELFRRFSKLELFLACLTSKNGVVIFEPVMLISLRPRRWEFANIVEILFAPVCRLLFNSSCSFRNLSISKILIIGSLYNCYYLFMVTILFVSKAVWEENSAFFGAADSPLNLIAFELLDCSALDWRI